MKDIDQKIAETEAKVKKLEQTLSQLGACRDELHILRRAKEILSGHRNGSSAPEKDQPAKRRDVDIAVELVNSAGEWLDYEEIYNRMMAHGYKPYKPTLSANLSSAARKGRIKEHAKRPKVFGSLSLEV